MPDELWPCPFCGAKAGVGCSFAGNWDVMCGLCGARTKGWPNRKAAVDNWNSRVNWKEVGGRLVPAPSPEKSG